MQSTPRAPAQYHGLRTIPKITLPAQTVPVCLFKLERIISVSAFIFMHELEGQNIGGKLISQMFDENKQQPMIERWHPGAEASSFPSR